MKAIIAAALFLISLTGFSQVKEFGWLNGKWKIRNEREYEVWHCNDVKNKMEGISYKINGADTVVTEKFTIRYERSSFYYIPDVHGDQPEVYFKITAHSDKGFTAENAEHDFPKIIRYQLTTPTSIKAEIEGDGKVIQYVYDKVK